MLVLLLLLLVLVGRLIPFHEHSGRKSGRHKNKDTPSSRSPPPWATRKSRRSACSRVVCRGRGLALSVPNQACRKRIINSAGRAAAASIIAVATSPSQMLCTALAGPPTLPCCSEDLVEGVDIVLSLLMEACVGVCIAEGRAMQQTKDKRTKMHDPLGPLRSFLSRRSPPRHFSFCSAQPRHTTQRTFYLHNKPLSFPFTTGHNFVSPGPAFRRQNGQRIRGAPGPAKQCYFAAAAAATQHTPEARPYHQQQQPKPCFQGVVVLSASGLGQAPQDVEWR